MNTRAPLVAAGLAATCASALAIDCGSAVLSHLDAPYFASARPACTDQRLESCQITTYHAPALSGAAAATPAAPPRQVLRAGVDLPALPYGASGPYVCTIEPPGDEAASVHWRVEGGVLMRVM